MFFVADFLSTSKRICDVIRNDFISYLSNNTYFRDKGKHLKYYDC